MEDVAGIGLVLAMAIVLCVYSLEEAYNLKEPKEVSVETQNRRYFVVFLSILFSSSALVGFYVFVFKMNSVQMLILHGAEQVALVVLGFLLMLLVAILMLSIYLANWFFLHPVREASSSQELTANR